MCLRYIDATHNTSDTNISLASFQLPSNKLSYLDPYNNTFGEEDWFVVEIFTMILKIPATFFVVLICSFTIGVS